MSFNDIHIHHHGVAHFKTSRKMTEPLANSWSHCTSTLKGHDFEKRGCTYLQTHHSKTQKHFKSI